MELKNISFQYGKYRLAGRGRYQPSNSVHFLKSDMVSVAVSLLETTELVFIEPGVNIDGAYTVTSCSVSTFSGESFTKLVTPSGAIWRHTYCAAVTTLSDTARTYSDYSGPRGGVAA